MKQADQVEDTFHLDNTSRAVKALGAAGCVRQNCYCRERKYCPLEDMDDFGYVIQAGFLHRPKLDSLPFDLASTCKYNSHVVQIRG